jgi:uncharacterized protein (TIGR00369 family)
VTEDHVSASREYDEAMKAGDYKSASAATRRRVPLHDQMGLAIVSRTENTITLTMELGDAVRGALEGSIHGGMLATIADVTSAFSLDQAYDGATEWPVTTDMHIRYYRQPRSGPLTAEATVVHRGRRLLSSECSIADGENRILARSTATYMIVPRPDAQPPTP